MRQVIYVVAESEAGPCKIGVATNMKVRMVMLQNGNPRKLILAHTREVHWPSRFAVEAIAHALVGELHRLSGEWFEVAIADAIRAVDEACKMMGQPEYRLALQEPVPPPDPLARFEPPAKVKVDTRPPSAKFLARRTERERKRHLVRPR